MSEKLERSATLSALLKEAAIADELTTVMCKDRATHEEVEVLCLRTEGCLRPIARFYPDVDYANADVTVPKGHKVRPVKLLH